MLVTILFFFVTLGQMNALYLGHNYSGINPSQRRRSVELFVTPPSLCLHVIIYSYVRQCVWVCIVGVCLYILYVVCVCVCLRDKKEGWEWHLSTVH